jgi:hypothetical protein
MALVLADVGADLFLNTFFVATAVQNLKCKLYATNVTPNSGGTDVVGTYTEAAGGGYTAGGKTVTRGSGWTLTVANDPSDVIYTSLVWTFTGPLTTNPTIYGYYVTDSTDAILLWSELLTTPFTPTNNGDTLTITLKFALAHGTPGV